MEPASVFQVVGADSFMRTYFVFLHSCVYLLLCESRGSSLRASQVKHIGKKSTWGKSGYHPEGEQCMPGGHADNKYPLHSIYPHACSAITRVLISGFIRVEEQILCSFLHWRNVYGMLMVRQMSNFRYKRKQNLSDLRTLKSNLQWWQQHIIA